MAEATPYKITVPGYPPLRLKVNKGGVLYVKGPTDHGTIEFRFPQEISAPEDLEALGYGKLTRADIAMAVAAVADKKPVREKSPEPAKKPVRKTAPAPQPKPKKKEEPKDDGNGNGKRSGLDIFKL